MKPHPKIIRLHTSVKRLAAPIAATIAILSVHIAHAEVIRLNPQATAQPKENVRLGDIATVKAADSRTAEELANLIILPEISDSRTLRAESVLMAVITQVGPGPLADHLQVAGSATCEIHVGDDAKKAANTGLQPVAGAAPAGIPATPAPSPAVVAAPAPQPAAKPPESPPQTLAKMLIAKLTTDLNASPDDLRISFDTMNPLLDQPAPAKQQWVFHAATPSLLGSVQFEAQLVEGSRIVQKLVVQVRVLRRESVLVAANRIPRERLVVTNASFKRDDDWIDRQMPTLLTNEKDVIGLEALRDVAAGSNLDQRDFKPVSMASRGESITVFFIHGNLKVRMVGRAMDAGKLHDSIPVRNDATNELYDAVLIGKRIAVVGGTLDDAQETQLREAAK